MSVNTRQFSKGSSMNKPTLYTCTSIENDWPHNHTRYKGVTVQWFVWERAADYAEQFAGYCDLKDPYSRGVIEEAFTADEALKFAEYLREKHQSEVKIEPQELPVPPNTVGAGAIAVGGTTDFYMLDRDEGYSLPVKVRGFYNVSGCEWIKDEPRAEIAIRPNNLAVKTRCALCDSVDRPDTPYTSMLAGTDAWVCFKCFEKHTGIKGAWEALDIFNGAMMLALRNKNLRPIKDALTRELGLAEFGGDLDETCSRCGAGEQATHHRLCQDRDGTPTELPDELVRKALAIPEDEAIARIAVAAFLDRINADDFLNMSVGALAQFRNKHRISAAVMNRAWQALQDHQARGDDLDVQF